MTPILLKSLPELYTRRSGDIRYMLNRQSGSIYLTGRDVNGRFLMVLFAKGTR